MFLTNVTLLLAQIAAKAITRLTAMLLMLMRSPLPPKERGTLARYVPRQISYVFPMCGKERENPQSTQTCPRQTVVYDCD